MESARAITHAQRWWWSRRISSTILADPLSSPSWRYHSWSLVLANGATYPHWIWCDLFPPKYSNDHSLLLVQLSFVRIVPFMIVSLWSQSCHNLSRLSTQLHDITTSCPLMLHWYLRSLISFSLLHSKLKQSNWLEWMIAPTRTRECRIRWGGRCEALIS